MSKRKFIFSFLLIIASAVASGLLFADGMTAADFVAEAKSHIKSINVTEAKGLFDKGGYLFLDVREPNETEMGTIPGAVLMPRGMIEFMIVNAVEDKNANIVVYCRSGGRSALATYTLVRIGYKKVFNMDGGWSAWTEAAYPVE